MPNPWVELPEAGPYVHANDAELLAARAAEFGPDHAIHLECLPEPFLGDPRAPVLLLSRNPGFDPRDPEVHAQPHFIAACRANLRHEPAPYPFYLLARDLADTPGGRYWREKLGHLASRLAQVLDLADDEDAWRVIARNVACVEYHAYHSAKYRPLGFDLFTQRYGRAVVRAATCRGAVVVALRSVADWLAAVPTLRAYPHLFTTNSAQEVTFTPTNCPGGWVPVMSRILAREGVATFTPGPEDLRRTRPPRARERGGVQATSADEPDHRDPQETVRLLEVLEGEHGLTVQHFRLLHHFGADAAIIDHRNHCGDTARFHTKSNNVIVARRLASCLTARRAGRAWEEALPRARRDHPFPPRKDGTLWANAS